MGDFMLWLLLGVLTAAVLYLLNQVIGLRKRYSQVVDIEAEASKVRSELNREKKEIIRDIEDKKKSLEKLAGEYTKARGTYDRLRAEISLLEESLEFISFGLYKPHYSFADPEDYKQELNKVYDARKKLIRDNLAMITPEGWTVNGSVREGKKMIKQESKLMLRAFNGELDAAVAKVSWNNILKMEERVTKTYQAVNDLGSVIGITISPAYLKLALAELRLTHEFESKKQEIKEEQRRIKEQMREEELAQREFERAKKTAEAEEQRYEKALKEAQDQLEKARAGEMEAIQKKVAELEAKVAEAQSKLDRAVSMAQLTKSGHVYIISNIGSFGEDVFKIGMTRRLDPTERVYELGSASVPFPYDIHGMMYTTDAPGLENSFHREFNERRVNLVNTRKEFFRVSIDELEKFASTQKADIKFTKLAEAREYRETLALIEKGNGTPNQSDDSNEIEEFPDSLLANSYEMA